MSIGELQELMNGIRGQRISRIRRVDDAEIEIEFTNGVIWRVEACADRDETAWLNIASRQEVGGWVS